MTFITVLQIIIFYFKKKKKKPLNSLKSKYESCYGNSTFIKLRFNFMIK